MKRQLLKFMLITIPVLGLVAFKNNPSLIDGSDAQITITSDYEEEAAPFFLPWTIYEADLLPGAFTPPFQTSSAGTDYTNAIVVDPNDATNNLLEMECPGDTFYWRMNFAANDITVDDLTVVFRLKGNPNFDVALDLDLHYDNLRTRVTFHKSYGGESNVARIRNGSGTNTPLLVDLDEWHTYRFTMTATQTLLYVDESTTPIMTITPAAATSGNRHFRFGDGDSVLNQFGASFDWVVWDVTGAYSPGEQPLPAEVLSIPTVAENTAWAGPVPTKDYVYVNHPNASNDSQITVYNISGQLVNTIKVNSANNRTQVDMSNFETGLYIIKYQNAAQQQQFKVLKQ